MKHRGALPRAEDRRFDKLAARTANSLEMASSRACITRLGSLRLAETIVVRVRLEVLVRRAL